MDNGCLSSFKIVVSNVVVWSLLTGPEEKVSTPNVIFCSLQACTLKHVGLVQTMVGLNMDIFI